MPTSSVANRYSMSLMLAGMACLVVAVFIWQWRRRATGARALFVFLLALTWWDLTYAIFWAGAPGPWPAFWLDLTFLGVVVTPAALLAFALQFTIQEHGHRSFPYAVLAIEPAIVLALLWTDPWYGLFFTGPRDPSQGMISDDGPVFWANIIYSYALVILSIGLILWRFFHSSGIYRRQAGVLLGVIGVAWLNSVIFIFGFSPLPNADNTPFAFSLAALGFAFALFRYHLLDVASIARDVLIEQMDDGIIVLDPQNRVVDINPTARRMLVVPTDMILGAPGNRLGTVWHAVIGTVTSPTTAHTEITIDTGPYRHVDVRISPLRDRDAQVVGRLIVCHDITERKRLEENLRESEAQYRQLSQELEQRVQERTAELQIANLALAKALKVKNEFMATMSHELRTPLNVILGVIEILQTPMYGQLTEKQHRAVGMIEGSGMRLKDVINDVLELTTLQSSTVALDPHPCAVNAVCELALGTIRSQAAQKHQQTHLAISPKDMVIQIDEQRIYQLLKHLVNNASKFTPDGGEFGIEVVGDREAQQIRMTVWDRGIGIAAQDLPRLFQPFVQLDARLRRQYEGTGLGLALVRHLAELLGGNIGVESTLDHGSRFTLTLPWAE